jgi:hypothetical protein
MIDMTMNTHEHSHEHTPNPSPLDDFDRLASIARDERPPLMRADVAAIRRRLQSPAHQHAHQHASQSDRQSMPATLMIFSSAFTGLAACAVVAVMLQMTHDVSQVTQAGSSTSAATQVGLTSPSSQPGSAGTGNPSDTAQASAQARNTSHSSGIDPVADLFQPLQLDLP